MNHISSEASLFTKEDIYQYTKGKIDQKMRNQRKVGVVQEKTNHAILLPIPISQNEGLMSSEFLIKL